MDVSSFLPNTDNLFKFLFLGGLIMVFTAMVYPLQKKQERELEIVNHNQQVELINKEIADLGPDISELTKKVKKAILVCSDLERHKGQFGSIQNRLISKQIVQIQTNLNASANILRKKKDEVATRIIIVKYNESKIILLNKYVDTYNAYSSFLLWIGIPLSCLGLLLWSLSTFNTEKLKTKELNRP
jgi:hypothetical protein